MAKRTKKDSDKPKVEETPEVMTSAEDIPKDEPEAKPEPKKPEPVKDRPDLVKAKQYLSDLKAEPAKPPPPRPPDTRAGKRPPPPNQPEPRLTARQFVRARKQRWERCAGFLLDMKRKVGPNAQLTMLEWAPLWDAFWKRPVGGCRR